MPKRVTICLILLLMLCHLPNHAFSTNPGLAREPSDGTGPIGLPGGCTKVTPPNGLVPACCVSGYIWANGQPVTNAEVVITTAGGNRRQIITAVNTDSPLPYYQVALGGPPLNIQPGHTITITARYAGHESVVRWTVKPGGQQVDLVLAKIHPNDYILEQTIWGQAAASTLNQPYGVARGLQGRTYVLDSDNARVQVVGPTGQLVGFWGSLGNFPGQMSRPRGIATDRHGNVYIADTGNHRIQKFGPDGVPIAAWGSLGSAASQFNMPTSIAVDSNSNVYIFDLGNRRIQKLSNSGQFLRQWPIDAGDVDSDLPNGIAVDGSGNVYLADTMHHRILKFNDLGVLLNQWGTFGSNDSEFIYPTGLAVAADNNVYVVDTQNRRVQRFLSNGTFFAKWDGPGMAYPLGMAISADGKAYVTDIQSHTVNIFTLGGVPLGAWGSRGAADGQLSNPQGIAIDSDGALYVLDTGNARIQKFVNGEFDLAFGRSGSGAGQILEGHGLAIDVNNRLFVADAANHQIRGFDTSGEWIGAWGGFGSNPGQMDNPVGIAVAASGKRFVLEKADPARIARVQPFFSNWQPDTAWGSSGSTPGQFDGPGDIVIDQAGNTYVADTYNQRVQRFNSDREVSGVWTTAGLPRGLALSTNGLLFVSMAGTTPIAIYDAAGTARGTLGRRGSGTGEFLGPDALTFDQDGRLYIADSANNRVQIWQPMNETRPIATINWINKRNLIQNQDQLILNGSGMDSDEDGDPAQFTYRWYFAGRPIGTGPNLQLPTSDLITGTHAISLTVTDDEGAISEPAHTYIHVSPEPETAWTVLLYLDADSAPDGDLLLEAMGDQFASGLLSRMARQPYNPYTRVVAQLDGYGFGDTRRLALNPDRTYTNVWEDDAVEAATDTPEALADFITWAKENYPARHYYLAIAGHGNGYQGVGWDDTSGPTSYLTVAELRRALETASGDGAAPIDVLHLDACSMALLDVAYELRDQIDYLVMSQNLSWGFFLQDRYRQLISPSTTPRQLGEEIVRIYSSHADSLSLQGGEQYPYTISLMDLRRVVPVVQTLDAFARGLAAFAFTPEGAEVIRQIRLSPDLQRFDSADFYYLDVLDEYVDLVDWTRMVSDHNQIDDQAIKHDARQLLSTIPAFVLDEANSADRFRMPAEYGGAPINLADAHGISLYYPIQNSRSMSTTIWLEYRQDGLFQMAADTYWNEFLRSRVIALPPPPQPGPEAPLPPPALPQTRRVFLPLLVVK